MEATANVENNQRPAQAQRVLQYMKDFGSITQLDALKDLGIMRLGARIFELRKKNGVEIESEFVTVKNRYGEPCAIKKYYLSNKNQGDNE